MQQHRVGVMQYCEAQRECKATRRNRGAAGKGDCMLSCHAFSIQSVGLLCLPASGHVACHAALLLTRHTMEKPISWPIQLGIVVDSCVCTLPCPDECVPLQEATVARMLLESIIEQDGGYPQRESPGNRLRKILRRRTDMNGYEKVMCNNDEVTRIRLGQT